MQVMWLSGVVPLQVGQLCLDFLQAAALVGQSALQLGGFTLLQGSFVLS